MLAREIISERMKERGFTNQALADKLGYSKASGISERLRNKTEMRVDIFLKMLTAMDCELIARSTTTPKKEWVVSLNEDE